MSSLKPGLRILFACSLGKYANYKRLVGRGVDAQILI